MHVDDDDGPASGTTSLAAPTPISPTDESSPQIIHERFTYEQRRSVSIPGQRYLTGGHRIRAWRGHPGCCDWRGTAWRGPQPGSANQMCPWPWPAGWRRNDDAHWRWGGGTRGWHLLPVCRCGTVGTLAQNDRRGDALNGRKTKTYDMSPCRGASRAAMATHSGRLSPAAEMRKIVVFEAVP